MATATRTTMLKAVDQSHTPNAIRILDNPLVDRVPALAQTVEDTTRELLAVHGLGVVEVRFRVCRELSEGLRFICKVENPPVREVDGTGGPWRWWSPLMETAQDFRAALNEALQVRRERLAAHRDPSMRPVAVP